jgi:hypothetical protein
MVAVLVHPFPDIVDALWEVYDQRLGGLFREPFLLPEKELFLN